MSRFCVHPKSHLTVVAARQSVLNCGACKCPIVGTTFNCSACNSDLHPFCKSCPSHLSSKLHHDHPLTLLTDGFINRRCVVCDEEIRGVVSYTCSLCNFDVHPLCSQLPLHLPAGAEYHLHPLHLQLGDHHNSTTDCEVCGRQCFKWAYKCDVCPFTIHYPCLSVKLISGTGDPQTRCLGPTWGYHPHPHPHQGGYGGNYYGSYGAGGYGGLPNSNYHSYGGYGSQGYGGGVPNYGAGSQGHGVQNYYNPPNTGGGGSSGGGGGFMGFMMGKIVGSVAVNVLCNLVAGSIQQDMFGS